MAPESVGLFRSVTASKNRSRGIMTVLSIGGGDLFWGARCRFSAVGLTSCRKSSGHSVISISRYITARLFRTSSIYYCGRR